MAERTALARILVDDQDLSPLEVDNIRNFLAQFESDGEVKTVCALSVILDGVEPDLFHVPVSCEYGSIILLLQIVWCFRNIPMKVPLRGLNNGAIDPQRASLRSSLTVERIESDDEATWVASLAGFASRTARLSMLDVRRW